MAAQTTNNPDSTLNASRPGRLSPLVEQETSGPETVLLMASTEQAHYSGTGNHNTNNCNNSEPTELSGTVHSASRTFKDPRAYKLISQNSTEKLKYLMKPIAFIALGFGLTCIGIALTASHFLYEDSLREDIINPPYFTFGPVTFASGLIISMIGVVWFSQKHHKWVIGAAGPIATAAAAAAALVTSATMTSEQVAHLPRDSVNGGVPVAVAVA